MFMFVLCIATSTTLMSKYKHETNQGLVFYLFTAFQLRFRVPPNTNLITIAKILRLRRKPRSELTALGYRFSLNFPLIQVVFYQQGSVFFTISSSVSQFVLQAHFTTRQSTTTSQVLIGRRMRKIFLRYRLLRTDGSPTSTTTAAVASLSTAR